MMISPKILIRMPRKWPKVAALLRKRVSISGNSKRVGLELMNCSSVATERGCFVVYTINWKRFVMPLQYLHLGVFQELFRISEEEFGLSSDGPIVLPCESTFLDYIVLLIRQGMAKEIEQSLIDSITTRTISAKKLIKLAKKWQKVAAIRRKRITMLQAATSLGTNSCSTSSAVEKGHFVVYSKDQKRFALSLNYLNKDIVRELFKLAEDEFGLPSNEPFTLPCDAAFLGYVISLIQKNATLDVEKALMLSVASRQS